VLEIAGLIDNPIGLTRLVNLNGPITATARRRIITNQLDVYAPRDHRRLGRQRRRPTSPSTSSATGRSRP
jgi:hypothetical protein